MSAFDETRSVAGATTVVGDGYRKPSDSGDVFNGKLQVPNGSRSQKTPQEPFNINVNYMDANRPFFIKIGKDGVIPALQKLDLEMRNSGQNHIISRKSPTDWIGREITPGQMGLVNHGGMPKLLTRPGRYPGFPLRNWWARSFEGTKGLSDTVVEFLGLTVVQVSQNQAAVISDPQNQIFVVKNGGFVALALEGSYEVLAVVDQTHLPNRWKDHVTGQILGSTFEVKMKSMIRGSQTDYVVATFLDIPANNCGVLQRGDDLELLGAGQHCITNPNVTLRGMYTCGENQIEMPTKDIYTRDQVPVSLTIYLKWQLNSPLMLTTHGYNTPYDALRDKAQSVLTQIVSHLDYSAMIKQRSLGGDHLQSGDNLDDPSAAFIDALRTMAMDELRQAALEYGIELKDLAVIDRQFKGDVAKQMENLTTKALQTQVEAANVDRENSNKIKQEQGTLSVARIKAQTKNTQADADAYSAVAAARAAAQALQIQTEAQAEATRVIAKAEADAIRLRALADADVRDNFAQEMQLRRIDVEKVKSYGDKAIFVPVGEGRVGDAMALGMAASMGAKNA